jgi:site-specific DNA-methyltransferase (adenine-specific)
MEPMSTAHEPEEIRMIFEPTTLAQLVWLKGELRLSHKVDRFLLASLAGILHANANRDGTTRGLSLAMPNTFAMSPGYVRRYVTEHNLVAPRLDVLSRLKARVESILDVPASFRRGAAWIQDARNVASSHLTGSPAKLVFTSPPYLEVMKYGKYNWIRLWLLGQSPKSVDSALFRSASLERYLEFMGLVLRRCRAAVRDDGYVCLVIGDVRRGDRELDLASAVAEAAVPASGLKVVGTVFDRLPPGHKVSRIWGETRGRATRIERILVLRGRHARTPDRLTPTSLGWRGST